MKNRNGFVSNSSSSSFVIAIKKDGETCPRCGRSDPDILDAINQREKYSDETCVDGMGIDAVLEYADELDECDCPLAAKQIREEVAKHEHDDKWEFAIISISYHDSPIETMLQNAEKAGTIKILSRE